MGIIKTSVHRVHFVGIKGVAMTALAIYYKEQGIQVTGSDVEESFPTKESLEKAGITPLVGFSPDHINPIEKPDLVIYTGANGGKDNVEVIHALQLGIPTLPHGKALGECMNNHAAISVAGSHGKTTTSTMIATILHVAGKDPSYAIGCGTINGVGLPGHFGKGREFVAEADEYMTDPGHDRTPRFLWQHPDVLVVTNIDFDHPDAYADITAVQDAFVSFQKQQQGLCVTVINVDDANSRVLQNPHKGEVLTYGRSSRADLCITDVHLNEGKTVFSLILRGMPIGETMQLFVPGMHNVLNATAAAAAAYALGLSWDQIKKGLGAFQGTKRRFETVGTALGMDIYDDYAHHPHEIAATLAGVRAWYPNRRIITIFQPHTYSRTKALFTEFTRCFTDSSIVCIADIYASAREHETLGVHASQLVEALGKEHSDVFYIKDKDGAIKFLQTHRKPGDIVIFMGAGDIADWGKESVGELSITN